MLRPQRLIAATILVALASALAGCGSMGNFDPTDMLDWLDTKKKLPGERKPVFPDGVPGLEQGVPKDLYKGARQQQIDDPNAQAAVAPAAPPPQEPKSKGSAKSRGHQAPAPVATAPAAEPDAAAEEEGGTAAAPPAPKPKKIVRKRTTAPPPDQPAAQSAAPAQSTQQSAAPFPAPMPSGTFTR
ncbi:MAG: hypothetical protein J0H42_26375 [Rhizobiales bacterium]|nr:hypothetical protein [Hyphomicrobiales bacterium]